VKVELCLFLVEAEANELGDELGVICHNDSSVCTCGK
jgi:hypothetical protein